MRGIISSYQRAFGVLRNLVILTVFLVASPAVGDNGPAVTGVGQSFGRALINGVPVDWCATWATNCGQPAADLFCRSQGFPRAERWTRAMEQRTYVLGDARFCDSTTPACGALRDVVCTGFGEAPQPAAGPIKVFSAVPTQPSSNFRAALVRELEVETSQWDRTPYLVTPAFNTTVTVAPGQRVLLAGDASGAAGWSIDNFVVARIGGKRLVLGAGEKVRDSSGVLESLPGGGVTDLTRFFQPGVPTPVMLMALDYGGVGGVSDVYLVVK